MIKYKQVNARNGRTMYYKNGNMVAKTDIPPSILNNLEPGVELSTGTPDPRSDAVSNGASAAMPAGGTVSPGDLPRQTIDENTANDAELAQDKSCIFCGEPGTRTRYINMATANLCEDDYQTHTTGEIAAQMREISLKDLQDGGKDSKAN